MKRGLEKTVFRPWEAWTIHLLTVFAGLCVAWSGVYVVWKLTTPIVVIGIIIALAWGWLLRPTHKHAESREEPAGNQTTPIIAAICDIGILLLLWNARTGEAIASPWQAAPWAVFPLYAIASGCLAWSLVRSAKRHAIPALLLHGVVTWGVSLIIYRLGFGYDPFVHQATEAHILTHGAISPKTPFYIGQYVTVVATALLTQMPVELIDRLLVPVLSAIFVPALAFIGLRRGWSVSRDRTAIGLAALLVLPIGYFAFTAPFNLALIPLVAIIFFLPLAHELRIRAFLMAMAAVALAIHPLTGIPAAVIAMTAILVTRRTAAWIPAVGIPLLLGAAFFHYLGQQGASASLPTAWAVIRSFFAVFGNPYELYLGSAPLAVYYAVLYASPVLLIGMGIHGFSLLVKPTESMRKAIRILFGSMVGFLVAALLMPVLFVIPNIIAMEQFEFSLRLVTILPLLVLPGIAIALHHWFTRAGQRTFWLLIACVAFGLVSLGAWFATYPQYNDIAYYPAPGLSKSDVDAVSWIDQDAGEASYAVLSHQMMSAAALQRFGFDRGVSTLAGDRYFYAIPTGGELYALYIRLLSEDPDPRLTRDEIVKFVQVDTIYVAVPDSWDRFGDVDKRMRLVADGKVRFGSVNIYKLKTADRE